MNLNRYSCITSVKDNFYWTINLKLFNSQSLNLIVCVNDRIKRSKEGSQSPLWEVHRADRSVRSAIRRSLGAAVGSPVASPGRAGSDQRPATSSRPRTALPSWLYRPRQRYKTNGRCDAKWHALSLHLYRWLFYITTNYLLLLSLVTECQIYDETCMFSLNDDYIRTYLFNSVNVWYWLLKA